MHERRNATESMIDRVEANAQLTDSVANALPPPLAVPAGGG
jgi:hypothetical protein